MTTLEAEIRLLLGFEVRKNIIIPGVTKRSNLVQFETDMLVLNKSGYASAIEIKISSQDLKKDKKKAHIRGLTESFTYKRRKITPEKVHSQLYKSIKYFYYAVPRELIALAKEEIPDICGLIDLNSTRSGKIGIIREAKLINPYKWTEEETLHLMRIGCMRIQSLKRALFREKS